ncbi:hypothetical protein ACNKHU_04435 [Shigella flexneri]
MIDIFPAKSDDIALRVELFGKWNDCRYLTADRADSAAIPRFTIYPKTHYVTPRERASYRRWRRSKNWPPDAKCC